MIGELPESVRKELAGYFSRQPEVVLAYLYGSWASGQVHARSDLDVGVLLTWSALPRLLSLC